MFYVDNMGNLVSNLKLAFYEYPDDKNFISKMIHDGNLKTTVLNHAKAYIMIQEIYDDILTSVRWKQIKTNAQLNGLDKQKALLIGQTISNNRNLEEVTNTCP